MPVELQTFDDLVGNAHPDTEAYRVYLNLKRDIGSGRVKPGQKLQTEWLRQTYHTSTSPVREALARLNAEQYVSAEGKRGFRATELDPDEYLPLAELRNEVECSALRKSIQSFSEDWEQRVLIAYHALSKARTVGLDDINAAEFREERHRRFHLELLSGCNSRWLMSMCNQLSSHAERYRRYYCRNATIEPSYFEKVDSEHRKLFEFAISGDSDNAVSLLLKHRERTMHAVLTAIKNPDKPIRMTVSARDL